MPDPTKEFFLDVDASDYAVGAVLLQLGEDGIQHPVAYFSQKHLPAERNYPVHDKELLAILKSLKHWRRYLEGTDYPVLINTDHRNLLYFSESRRISQRHARWVLELSDFCFQLQYKKGSLNTLPDALSRHPTLAESDEEYVSHNTVTILPPELFVNNLSLHLLETDFLNDISKAQSLDEKTASLLFQCSNQETPLESGSRANEGLLFHHNALVVPTQELQFQITMTFHDSLPGGHAGYKRTLARVRDYYWWPKISTFVKEYIAKCVVCTRNKNSSQRPQGLLCSLPIPEDPGNWSPWILSPRSLHQNPLTPFLWL